MVTVLRTGKCPLSRILVGVPRESLVSYHMFLRMQLPLADSMNRPDLAVQTVLGNECAEEVHIK
jgi:hypothetical protein